MHAMRKNTGERREKAPHGLRSLMRSSIMQDFSKHSLLDVLLPFIRKFCKNTAKINKLQLLKVMCCTEFILKPFYS